MTGGTGLFLGKFMPPHRGHLFALGFAERFQAAVDGELVCLVCSLPSEPIPGELRSQWMRSLAAPNTRVLHHPHPIPQTPEEHPRFWEIWSDMIFQVVGPVDRVFASEMYGVKLAQSLGAEFIPIDIARQTVSTSATTIRSEPSLAFSDIASPAQPWFCKTVAFVGAESTGKTTLAQMLAEHFAAPLVPEWARGFLELRDPQVCVPEDIPVIFEAQNAATLAAARLGSPLVVSDTDLITTCLWSELLFSDCDSKLWSRALDQQIHLTLIPDPDGVPLQEDPQRYGAEVRMFQLAPLVEALDRAGRTPVVLSGTLEQRFEAAITATERLLSSPLL